MTNLPEVQSILAKAGLMETRKKMYEKSMSLSVSSNASVSQFNDSKNKSKNNISKLQQSFNNSNLSKGQIKLMNSNIKRIQLQKGNLKLTNDSLDPTMNWIKIDEKNKQKEKKVKISVEGVGKLQGFGSSNPSNEEDYFSTYGTTFDGDALACIRAGHRSGTIEVTISADGCASVQRTIDVVEL